MSSTTDKLTKAIEILGLASAGLDVIARITDNTTDDKAADGLAAVRAVLSVIADGSSEKLTAEAAFRALAELSNRIAANDAVADAALDAKFRSES